MSVPDYWQSQKLTQRSVLHTSAEVCVNCWYFVDDTGVVIRLAAKAYALSGTDEEKLGVLKALSGTDHLTAIQGKVPQRYILNMDEDVLRVAVLASVLSMDPIPVFEDLFQEITDTLPDLIRSVDDNYEQFNMELAEPFLWVLTSVFEAQDGSLIARVT